jgi:transforming growth factor-beta-induced protein
MTKLRKISIAIAAACAIGGASGPVAAKGPGKPGVNPFAPGGNIVQVAVAANAQTGEFDYLLAAVGCLTDASGNNPVVSALTGDDMLTLFAPTDTAFEELQTALGISPPAPAKTCLLGAATVASVLTYHVTDGRRFANSVFNANNPKSLLMLNGAYVTTNPDLTITDVAGESIGVVPGLVNINARNGVIHVIDTVMLPFTP